MPVCDEFLLQQSRSCSCRFSSRPLLSQDKRKGKPLPRFRLSPRSARARSRALRRSHQASRPGRLKDGGTNTNEAVDIFPLTFLSSDLRNEFGASNTGSQSTSSGTTKGSGANQSVKESSCPFSGGGIYEDKLIGTINCAITNSPNRPIIGRQRQYLFVKGSDQERRAAKLMLMSTDFPWASVKIEAWDFQVGPKTGKKKLSKKMRDVERDITATRWNIYWAMHMLEDFTRACISTATEGTSNGARLAKTLFADNTTYFMERPLSTLDIMATLPLVDFSTTTCFGHTAEVSTTTTAEYPHLAFQQDHTLRGMFSDYVTLDLDQVISSTTGHWWIPWSGAKHTHEDDLVSLCGRDPQTKKLCREQLDHFKEHPFTRLTSIYIDTTSITNTVINFANDWNDAYASTSALTASDDVTEGLLRHSADADKLLRMGASALEANLHEPFIEPLIEQINVEDVRINKTSVLATNRLNAHTEGVTTVAHTISMPAASSATIRQLLSLGASAATQDWISLAAQALSDLNAQPTVVSLSPGLTFDVHADVMRGDGSATLGFNFLYNVKVNSNSDANNSIDVIQSHTTQTSVGIEGFDLLDVANFAIEAGQSPPYLPIPILYNIPLVGKLFTIPWWSEPKYAESLVMISATVIPQAWDVETAFHIPTIPLVKKKQ